MAYGVYAKSTNDGVVTVGNSGDIAAHSDTMVARGVYAYGLYGQVEVDNTGSIDASGGSVAMGVHALTAGGSIVVNNGGDIHAGDSDTAIAVLLGNYAVQPYGATDWTPGTSTLNNAGTISVDGDVGQAFAVAGNAAARLEGQGVALRHLFMLAPPVERFAVELPRQCPITVVQPEDDEVVTPARVYAWSESLALPHELLRVPGCSHFFHGKLIELKDLLQPRLAPAGVAG